MSDPNAQPPDFSHLATQQQGAQPPPSPAQQDATPPVGVQQPPAQSQEPELSDYAKGILGQVPEAHRAIVQQYLPQWDAGVSRRLGEIERVYKPFEQFLQTGLSVSDLETATLLYDMVTSDPQGAVDLINRMNNGQVGQQGQPPAQPQQYGQPQYGQQQYGQQQYGQQQQQAQLPPELQQQLTQMNQFMQQFALTQQQQEQQRVEAEQDRALDDYMKNLRTEKGDFDETWVLDRMSEGIDGAEAVDMFNNMIQQRVQQVQQNGQSGAQPGIAPQLPAPPVVNGGSAMPTQRSVTDYTPAEVRATVAQILNHANAQPS